ncbi:TetR/AcrR family transcriptional regulator [Streptomyces smyrnaeus]|uniref:TetR/AcrR family transcriptional regulator n=1 Tax=Streptomyces smyrnaeus TaxID=1387713 RepID=A0ABS3Y033_9ACTN|nr:TetR/AcrR family transcriptional regulator [Streptomyces smyrnaeus]MBO8200949.1 TetR/AcrR family transcriptional regulator [Streptomyces smyrnaeus]
MTTRDTYRHGNLRHALIAAGVELARAGGPDAVVLREATRRAGVVPNAAYRHFTDRRALLSAVSQAALAHLARAMEHTLAQAASDEVNQSAAQAASRPGADTTSLSADAAPDAAATAAHARLRALMRGYLGFAQAEPGLFRAAFATTEMADTDAEAATGAGGRTAFRMLADALDELTACGAVPPERRPGSEYFVWATVHGMATLLIDGPLRHMLPTQVEEAVAQVMEAVGRGL